MKADKILSQLDPRGNIVDRMPFVGYTILRFLIFENGVERFRPRIVSAHPVRPTDERTP